MNYFKTQLEKARKDNMNILDLFIAEEVECVVCSSDSEIFEQVCSGIRQSYLKSSGLTINQLCRALNELLESTAIDEIDWRWGVPELACYMEVL